jgi:hypothetical protein
MTELHRLIGVKTNLNSTKTLLPSIGRLNQAVALLQGEGRPEEARSLLEAAYARELALEQFESTYFAGLAQIAFERGDKALALKWLQLLVDLTKPDRNQEAAATIASLRLIAEHSDRPTGSASTEDVSQIDSATALKLAAETSSEFGEFEVAIAFRQQLLVESPDDEQNQLELVRLLGVNGKLDDAIQNLAEIIGNRALTRSTRWQAVWFAPELLAQDASRSSKLRDRVRTLTPNDSEMNVALEALSLSSDGQFSNGAKLLAAEQNRGPNAYLRSLQAIIEKKAGAYAESWNSFTRALIESHESGPWQSFAFLEDEPIEQIVALYLKENQPGAALKTAERVAVLQPNKNSAEAHDQPEAPIARYQTLAQRAEERKRASHLNLLALLSVAAEQLGDWDRAYQFEQLRLSLLIKTSDRDLALARLNHLREVRNGAQPRKLSLVIDQKLVGAD